MNAPTKPSGATGIDREHQAYVDGLRQQLTEVKEAHKAALESGRIEYARRVKAESGLAELLECAKGLVADVELEFNKRGITKTHAWNVTRHAIAKATNPNATVTQVAPAGRWTEKGTV